MSLGRSAARVKRAVVFPVLQHILFGKFNPMWISTAYAQTTATGPGGTEGALLQFLPFVFIFVIFYFLLIRPQQRRMKEHRAMIDAVKKGDEVVTGGGLIGKVTGVKDSEVEVELGPNTRVRVIKGTLSEVRTKGAPLPANDPAKS